MPSDKALTNVTTGAGKLHANVATAAADFQSGSENSGLAAVITALNREIAVPAVTGPITSTGDSYYTLSGSTNPIWIGDNFSDPISSLFQVVKANDETDEDSAPYDITGAPITVASLTTVIIGTAWYTGSALRLNFSSTIPNGTIYKIYYARRYIIQNFPIDALTFPTIKNSIRADSKIQNVLRALNGKASANWTTSWTSTVNDLANSGLNERYRRSTTGSGNLDTAGDGAVITRDGQAPTVQSSNVAWVYSSAFAPDSIWANYLSLAGTPAASNGSYPKTDGGIGFVAKLQQKTVSDTDQYMNAAAWSAGSRLDVIERNANDTEYNGTTVRTRIRPTNASLAYLNPTSGTSDDTRRTIQLGTGDYFYHVGTGLSEVAVGRDMIEIQHTSGKNQTYIITWLDPANARIARVRLPTGSGATLFPSGITTAVLGFRFIKVKYFQGVGTSRYVADFEGGHEDPMLLGHFYHAVSPPTTVNVTTSSELDDVGDAEFFARGRTLADNPGSSNRPYALRFGGHNSTSRAQEVLGGLRGDGAVECSLLNRTIHTESITTSGARVITWHPSIQGSTLLINMSHGSGVATITVNINTSYSSSVVKAGDEIVVMVRNSTSAPVPAVATPSGATFTITWNAIFRFHSGGATPIVYNSNSVQTIQQWKGVYSSLTSDFHMIHEVLDIGAGG